MTAPDDTPDSGAPTAPSARMTPYELVFTGGEFEANVFPRISAEAEEQGVSTLRPEPFAFLSTAADVVREVTPEDAPPEALDQYRALLFHAYHFWRDGRKLYVIERAAARYLVEAGRSIDAGGATLPFSAAYLQLPTNLFWGSIDTTTPPEPIDGFFLTQHEGTDPLGEPFHRLELLMVLGIRRSRAGFSVIPLASELDESLDALLREPVRPEGDFANVLPGGEIDGLYSVLTAAEALKLVVRTFAYAGRNPEAVVPALPPETRPDAAVAPPTHLAHTLITLGGGDGAPAPRA